MKVDVTSMFFNSSIKGGTATAAWGTSIGQNASKSCKIETEKDGVIDFIIGMTYNLSRILPLWIYQEAVLIGNYLCCLHLIRYL